MNRVTPVSPWMNFLPEPPAVLSANPKADMTVLSSSQVKSFGALINLASAFSFLLMTEAYADFAPSATNSSCKQGARRWHTGQTMKKAAGLKPVRAVDEIL